MTELKRPILTAVVAVADNGVIGKDGSLPWRMRDDLKWFKSVTLGKPVIMGRTTFEDLGKPLPGRLNIVLTRRAMAPAAGMVIAHEIDDALAVGHGISLLSRVDETCIIGGAAIYEATLPLCQRLYVTRVHAEIDGDRRLDLPPTADWRICEVGRIDADERNQFGATIERWDRK